MVKFKITKLDTDNAKQIEEKLKQTHGFCPCAIVHNKDTKCMCKEFRETQETSICHCGLYKKERIEE